MQKHHHLFLLLCTLTILHSTSAMEPEQPSFPSLYDLCKNDIIKGYGTTYQAQCKDALKSIAIIEACRNENYVKNFKSSFVHDHLGSLPCTSTTLAQTHPTILMHNNDILYGIVAKHLYLWNTATNPGELVTEKKISNLHRGDQKRPQPIQCAMIAKDRSLLYIGARSGGIKIWNITPNTPKLICMLPGSFWIKTKAFTESDGDLCSAHGDKKIRIWDIATEPLKQTLCHSYTEKHKDLLILKLLAEAHMLYAAGRMATLTSDSPILMYDTRERRSTNYVNSHDGAITHLAKSKKDMQFYSSSIDKTICVWDKRNMEKSIHTLQHTDCVQCVEEDSEGRFLFACTGDGMYTWDITTEKPYIINKMTPDAADCMAQNEHESQLFIGTETGIKMLESDCSFDTACSIINKW